MALAVNQQIQDLITKSRHTLVTFRAEGAGDALGSALGLYLFLKKKGARVDIASDDIRIPPALHFLPSYTDIKKELPPLQKFIIKVDIARTKLESLSYDVKDDALSIFLTPKVGMFNREQITTTASGLKYDLIITIDTPDRDALGHVFTNNTDLFYKTPVINIDHHASNEHYGHINVVDLAVSSTAELMARMLEEFDSAALDKDIATALLTGMIANTKSFKTANVTPATLQTASRLMKLGADRDAIVERLYRSKSLATLKLWGIALNRLQYDQALGLMWCALGAEDFVQTQTTPEQLSDIIDEILMNAPEAKMILLLYQDPHALTHYQALMRVFTAVDARLITKQFNPQGSAHAVAFAVPATGLLEAVQTVKDGIANFVKQGIE